MQWSPNTFIWSSKKTLLFWIIQAFSSPISMPCPSNPLDATFPRTYPALSSSAHLPPCSEGRVLQGTDAGWHLLLHEFLVQTPDLFQDPPGYHQPSFSKHLNLDCRICPILLYTIVIYFIPESFSHKTGNFLKAETMSYLFLHRPQILAKFLVYSGCFLSICDKNGQKSHEIQSRLIYKMNQLFRKC